MKADKLPKFSERLTLVVGAPVLDAEPAVVLEQVQPFAGADVPVALLLDLGEQPRLEGKNK